MLNRRRVRSLVGPLGLVSLICGLPLAQVYAAQAPAPAKPPAAPATTAPVPVAPAPQTPPGSPQSGAPGRPPVPRPAGPTQEIPLPSGFVIGPDDVLNVLFRVEKDMSAEVTVRPDGIISLPLLNEIQAGGLTPEQLREKITKDSMKFLVDEPTVSVIVKTINSRKVYITGGVGKPGPYNLSGPTTVVQLISMAGGIAEFSDSKHILIVRNEGGKQVSYPFNYKDFVKRKNLKQNIELRPGDTVVVP